MCVDKDGEALRLGQLSCDENGIRKGVVQFVSRPVGHPCSPACQMENSVEEYLHGLAGNHAGHDVIVIDPPTIADKTERKSKSDVLCWSAMSGMSLPVDAKLHSIENVVAKAVPHLVSRGLLHVTNGDNVGISSSQLAAAVGRIMVAAGVEGLPQVEE